jgi:hypothetical protein
MISLDLYLSKLIQAAALGELLFYEIVYCTED